MSGVGTLRNFEHANICWIIRCLFQLRTLKCCMFGDRILAISDGRRWPRYWWNLMFFQLLQIIMACWLTESLWDGNPWRTCLGRTACSTWWLCPVFPWALVAWTWCKTPWASSRKTWPVESTLPLLRSWAVGRRTSPQTHRAFDYASQRHHFHCDDRRRVHFKSVACFNVV